MDNALVYFLVLAMELLAWALAMRSQFCLALLRGLTVNRNLLQPRRMLSAPTRGEHLVSKLGATTGFLESLYQQDDRNITGFIPARIQRALVAVLVVLQNLMLIIFPWAPNESINTVSRRCGKLASVNAACLGLLAHSMYTISRAIGQSDRQIGWMHVLFAWICGTKH
jgi:hypothetical protein